MVPRSVKAPGQLKGAQESDIEPSTLRKKRKLTTSIPSLEKTRGSSTGNKTAPNHTPKHPFKLEDTLWSVYDVLCESFRGADSWVLVVWTGCDPAGSPWDHNYEPVSSLGEVLVRGWNLKKAAIQGAKNRKNREQAARRTIHWYLATVGEDTVEYNEQLASGTLEKSLLAQESPWFTFANYPSPEVQRFHCRRVSSSKGDPSLEPSSPIPTVSSKDFESSPLVENRPTPLQLETALPYESPSRSQIPEVHLPPPPSHPEDFHFISASQIVSYPYTRALSEERELEIEENTGVECESELQDCEPSVDEVDKLIIPDSQGFSGESISARLHSNSSSLEEAAYYNRGANDPNKSTRNHYRNSLGFTQFHKSYSHSTREVPYTLYPEPELDIIGSCNPRSTEVNVKVSYEIESQFELSEGENDQSLANTLNTPQNSSSLKDSSRGLDSTGFASQIPYVHSQRPSKSELQPQSFTLSSKFAASNVQSTIVTDSEDIQLSAQIAQQEDFNGQVDSFFEPLLQSGSTDPTAIPSPFAQNTYSSLARPPSKSPEILENSLLAPKSARSPSQINFSSLEMSNRTRESPMESNRRERKESGESRDTSPGHASPNSTELPASSEQNNITSEEIFLSMPLEDSARALYKGIFKSNEKLLDDLAKQSISPESLEVSDALAKMTEQLFNTCAHIELVENDVWSDTQPHLNEATQADFTAAVSSKCSFLKGFLLGVSHVGKHVIVYAKTGRFMDILESFLRANQFTFARPEQNVNQRGSQGKLKVTLLSSRSEASINEAADLVIGLDETFHPQDERVEQVRLHDKDRHLCPLICLVVHHSIEHISRCQQNSAVSLVLSAKHNSSRAGDTLPDDPPPDAIGEKVAALFLSSRLSELTSVFDLELDLSTPNYSTPNPGRPTIFGYPESGLVDAAATRERSEISTSEALKRPIDAISDYDLETPAKRARQSSGEVADDLDSHAVPLIESTTQDGGSIPERTADTNKMNSSTALATMEEPAVEVAATAEAVAVTLRQKESLAKDLENELGKLQTRFEEQSIENHRLHTELANERASLIVATTRINKISSTGAELRAEQTALQAEILSLRQALAGSDDEATKKLGELWEKAAQVDKLEEKLKSAEKKIESAEKNIEFIRQYYEETSKAAKDLQQENEDLKRRANDQAVKLRATFIDKTGQAFKDELKSRDAEKVQADRALKIAQAKIQRLQQRLEHEERRAGMSMNTRSNSVPVQDHQLNPAATTAANAMHGTQPSRHLAPTGNSLGRGWVSAGASRASSPASQLLGKGGIRASQLHNVELSEDK